MGEKCSNFALAFRGSPGVRRKSEEKKKFFLPKNLVSSEIRRNFAELFAPEAGAAGKRERTLKDLQ